jgi:DNA-binding beta-propeller fold protein YncE
LGLFCMASVINGVRTANAANDSSSFTLFESGQVRPLALSPDGKRLFAVNTPDGRLEVFQVIGSGLKHRFSVQVGLEPVAVAARTDDEVWVVNHLSDSVSVVDVGDASHARVMRTLLVGDEPRDIVFAGPSKSRAFITTAHRGQNTPRDPQLTTPGVGRADVWVFDAENLGDTLEDVPLTVITLFTDTPRALAVTPDGGRVYAAGFHTGNKTTTINEFLVRQGISPPFNRIYPEPLLDQGPVPQPLVNHAGIGQPSVGLIVQFEGGHWVDNIGQVWDDMVPFELPDRDVFTIDAMADPPREVADGAYSGVGTVLFNMIVNPVNGHVYVANTDAQNQNRFEGPGVFAGHSARGHLHESHITVLGRTPGSVEPRHLNKHIDYSHCCAPIPNAENDTSVAFPQDMALTADGSTLFVAAFGTSEVAVYDTGELENDSFVPNVANQIHVSGGGPSGLAMDEKRGRLYVLTRFDNGISTVDLDERKEVGHLHMFNPEPEHIVKGRRFLYDASFSSSHGDSACASCHVFGDFDSLAWDLGNPDADQTPNTGPFRIDESVGFFLLRAINLQTGQLLDNPVNPHFPPMKGPVTTQSLRGLDNHGSMHWRGDRTGGNRAILPDEDAGPNMQPNGGSFNEDLAFRKFNITFVDLNGRDAMIPPEDMQAFTDFILEITYPPNPIRNLDNSLTEAQQRGHDFFLNGPKSDTFFPCSGCHVLDRDGNRQFPEVKHPGFFGTDGQFSFEGESQFFKIPHLRNLYQKVGSFGMAALTPPVSRQIAPLGSLLFAPLANIGPMGPQVRGFGFLHDGSVDTVFRFVSASVFFQRPPGSIPSLDPRTPPELVPDPGNVGGLPNPAIPGQDLVTLRRDLEAFLLAFDSNLAPIVGQQATLTATNAAVVGPRIDLLINLAEAKECDLVARTRKTGYLYRDGRFVPASVWHRPLLDAELRTKATKRYGEVTYTCVPPGSGQRMALSTSVTSQ